MADDPTIIRPQFGARPVGYDDRTLRELRDRALAAAHHYDRARIECEKVALILTGIIGEDGGTAA